ncbi:MAG: amino acid adenylation domain-containing protein, partial [Chloroflexi bacterium]|nr:amino acid adenylation domain-containing protein [Chloroflexota bacterium]
DTDLFERATIERLVEHWGVLLDGIAADPERRLSELPLLSEVERQRIVADWNQTARPYPTDATLASLFAAQVIRTPDAVAVIAGERRLTYRELDTRATQVAQHLRTLGVGPNTLVGVFLERSPDLVAAVLGILAAGGAYVPLDPSYPAERLAWMAEDAQLTALVTHSQLLGRLPTARTAVVCLDTDACDPAPEAAACNLAASTSASASASASDLAYVIYTSGSTGRPKGVMVPHGAVVNTLLWLQETFPLGHTDTVAQKTAASFTDSVWELFWPLLEGAKLAILSDDEVRDPELLYRALDAQRVTVTQFVPPQLRAFLEWLAALDVAEPLPALRWIFNGGEALPPHLAQVWYARCSQARIANSYGMTESAIYATCALVEPTSDGSPPRVLVGHPIANASAYVLDRWGHPCPPGLPGEIHLGGRGLARGYLNLPDLTAERFIPDPFSTAPDARLYKTGDLGRYLPDGAIDYLGRLDNQIKIRGFRVEPGEIEATLRDHSAVAETVAILREDRAGDPRLVAYLVGVEGATLPGAEALRAFVSERLPEYMVPAAFVALDVLPLTPSGKLDRRALPAPSLDGLATGQEYAAPRTPAETLLAGLWTTVLGVERVGIRDDFFGLGGHSLLATRMLARVRAAFGVELPLRAAFETRTVAALAARIEAARAVAIGRDEVPLVQLPHDAPPPLSFAQQRLWVLDQLDGGSPRYNVPLALRLRGKLDRAALASALRALAARHETLRTTFVPHDGQASQAIACEPMLALGWLDLQGVPAGAREAELTERLAAEALRPFDLATGPLARATVLQLGDAEYVLAVTVHHSVADGWSLGVLWRDLAALYGAAAQGRAADLPPLPIQYADYAAWQRAWLAGPRLERQLAYWR